MWISPDDENTIADEKVENLEKALPEEEALDKKTEKLLHSAFHN